MRAWFARPNDEQGATLVIVTLATIMLFGFAALAVDVGHGMGERRRAQGTADASVLAAGVEVNLAGVTLQDLVDKALAFADANAPAPIPTEKWLNDCPDTLDPAAQLEHTAAELGLVPATDCISFNATLTKIRVSLPQRDVDTFFAGVIGIDTLDVTAFAEATMGLSGLAPTPPFVVTAGHAGGDQVCLRTSSSSAALPPQFQGNGTADPGPGDPLDPDHADPCDDNVFDPDSQFFGTIKAHTYSNCKQPSGNTGISTVIADGIDHILGSFGDYEVGVNDTELIDGCTSGVPQEFPNTMELQTGFTAQVLKLGLLSTSATTPRLARSDYQTATTFAGEGMNNRPLWTYIRSDINDNEDDDGTPPEVDPACRSVVDHSDSAGRPESGYDYFDLKEMMVECLEGFGATGQEDRIFGDEIVTSARFAWIPLLDESNLSSLSKKKVHINLFVPVFIQKLYQQGKSVGSPDPFCFAQHPDEKNTGWYMHEAGQDTGACGRSNQNVDRLGALILHCRSLPQTVCVDDSASDNPGGRPVFNLELTK
jgi:hypothetical protein